MQQNDSMMRLDRFLSGESEMTRSEVKKKIKSGLVEVNGKGSRDGVPDVE